MDAPVLARLPCCDGATSPASHNLVKTKKQVPLVQTVKGTHSFLGLLSTDETKFDLRPGRAVQPIRIFVVCLGNFVLPDERYHDLVRPHEEPTRVPVAPIPSDAERYLPELLLLARIEVARAPCGLFAAEVHLELHYRGGTGYLVLVDAWSIDCHIVLVSVQRSLVFRIELKIPVRPD